MVHMPLHILLVEDSPTDANLLCQTIVNSGRQEWRTTWVERVYEAIDICQAEQFDIVLLDLGLPDSSGLETLQLFLKAIPHLPTVVLTGLDDEDMALQAMAEGAQDYLVKDEITDQQLLRSIRYALERDRILKQLQESEQRVRAALVREEELNRLKSSFVSMVSHEFRTPMTVIRTAIELLQKGSTAIGEIKRNEYFERIKNSIKQVLYLLDDILILSRMDANKLEFRPASLDLVDFCRELTESLQLTTEPLRTIAFEAIGICTPAQLDENLLRPILTNLLSNALKYSSPEKPVSFSLACNAGEVIFCVQDQGIGVPEQDLPHLFETFHRGSNVGKTQGTGLGLAIVKRCIEMHHGSIQVESQVGVGTRIVVTLPLES